MCLQKTMQLLYNPLAKSKKTVCLELKSKTYNQKQEIINLTKNGESFSSYTDVAETFNEYFRNAV